MNEKLQYAEMLDIPVSTCNITYKPQKRRLFKRAKVNPEQVKQELLDKVNLEQSDENIETNVSEYEQEEYCLETLDAEGIAYDDEQSETKQAFESSINIREMEKPQKKTFKFSIIALQLMVIGVLLTTIFLTNALIPSSGINNFIKGVFGTGTQASEEDVRLYSEFNPALPTETENILIEDGIMTFSGNGSIYPPCDGTITSLTTSEDGKYTLTIMHNKNFSSILTGVDYAYCEKGDKVLSNIPVGYTLGQEVTLCFTGGDGSVITDYSLSENSVIWAV